MVGCRDFFWLISVHIGNARSATKGAAARTPSISTACRGALRRGLCGRSYPPYPRATTLILPKIRKVHRPHPTFIFPAFMGFPFPIQVAVSIHKRRPPCQQSPHIRAAFPICRRRSPIRFHGSHNLHMQTQIPIGSAGSPHVSTAPPYNL